MIALFVEQGKSPSLREIPDSYRGRVFEREDQRSSLGRLVHPGTFSPLSLPIVSYTKFHWRSTMVLNNTEVDIFTDTSSTVNVPFLEALNTREHELVLLLKAIVLSLQDDDAPRSDEPLPVPAKALKDAEQYDLVVSTVLAEQEGLALLADSKQFEGLILAVKKA